MKRLLVLLAAVAASLVYTAGGHAAVIASYDAARDGRPYAYADDPTEQGWDAVALTVGDPTSNPSGTHVAGPVDAHGTYQGTESPLAWRVSDQGTSKPLYQQPISAAHLDLMASNPAGWRLESDVRFQSDHYVLGFYVADTDWNLGGAAAHWFRVVSRPPTADGKLSIQIGENTNVNTGIDYDANKFYNVVLESVFTNPYRYTVTIDGKKLPGDYGPYGYGSVTEEGALFGSNSGARSGIVGDVASYELSAPCRRILLSHYGANDPAGEGWTQAGTPRADLYAEAVTDDFGYDAWKVVDDSTASGALNYVRNFTEVEDLALIENGWIMRARLRVEDVPNTIETAVGMQVALDASNQLFSFGLSVDDDDNTIFGFSYGGNFTNVSGSVEGLGYHLYEMVYDPTTQTVDLFVDGEEKITDFPGLTHTAGLKRVLFGANSTAGTGTGYYNMVEFIVVPEPGSVALLLALAVTLLGVRPRRRS